MKENTAILPLKDYNELKELRENLMKSNILVEYSSHGLKQAYTKYYTRDELIEKLSKEISECNESYRKLTVKHDKLEEDYRALKEEIESLKIVKKGEVDSLVEVDDIRKVELNIIENKLYAEFVDTCNDVSNLSTFDAKPLSRNGRGFCYSKLNKVQRAINNVNVYRKAVNEAGEINMSSSSLLSKITKCLGL